jgi:hypothetical protein
MITADKSEWHSHPPATHTSQLIVIGAHQQGMRMVELQNSKRHAAGTIAGSVAASGVLLAWAVSVQQQPAV